MTTGVGVEVAVADGGKCGGSGVGSPGASVGRGTRVGPGGGIPGPPPLPQPASAQPTSSATNWRVIPSLAVRVSNEVVIAPRRPPHITEPVRINLDVDCRRRAPQQRQDVGRRTRVHETFSQPYRCRMHRRRRAHRPRPAATAPADMPAPARPGVGRSGAGRMCPHFADAAQASRPVLPDGFR